MQPIHAVDRSFQQETGESQGVCGLHYAHYNFVRAHRSLRMTPDMAASVTDRLWSVEELVQAATNV